MDLISRETAKNYIDSQKGRPFIGCTIGEAMKIMLDEVPSAKPERRKGEWIYDTERVWHDGGIHSQYHCSVCGFQIFEGRCNFCPYCGAEMRGDNVSD